MHPTTQQLYTSILHRAAEEWNIEYDDADRDIGQQFDPIVRFMAGAVSSELERVYQHLHDTESRLQERLARVLLPEYFHLPTPAHALAIVTSKGESVIIGETTTFETVEEEENEPTVAFSPLMPVRILPTTIRIVATEQGVINLKERSKLRRGRGVNQKMEVQQILLGIEASDGIDEWKGACLYFDLKGKSGEGQKARFLTALKNSRCFLNGEQELKLSNGLPNKTMSLEDNLNGNERLFQQVKARYDRHFLTFREQDLVEVEPISAEEFLPKWFATTTDDPEVLEQKTAGLAPDLEKPLLWVEIRLARPVELVQPNIHLSAKINVFPVVNRRLHGNGRGEHFFFLKHTIQWVHLQPKDDFVAIRKIYEDKSPSYQEFAFKPFADFKAESKPAYTIRHGGVGRWDDFNVWQRLAYVVQILQDNYAHQTLIQEAAGALSLEDIHHLLGKKINKTAAEKKPTKDIYVLLHKGNASRMRVRVEYWTSLGAEANGITAKTPLICTSKENVSFERNSLALVTMTEDGRNALDRTQQLTAMKSTLLSRGRIVTREDVKSSCRTFLQEKLSNVVVKDGVGIDSRFDFGMTRLLDVFLEPAPNSKKEDWEGICQQLQGLLEQKSTSSIPIRVRVLEEN